MNSTAARLLPSLLRVACEADPVLQVPIADFVGKLLCEGRAELRNATLRAIEPFVFERAVPPTLVFALGLGDGTGLKVLLDAAELAHRRGDDDTATTALLAVNWIFQRNFPHHAVMGEILLHRMLYLSGPALAFALLLARRRVTGTGFHYPAETLLSFIDEAAVERPSLVPELARCFYVGLPKDEAECRQRMAFFATLRSREAREAALREYLLPPEEGPEELRRISRRSSPTPAARSRPGTRSHRSRRSSRRSSTAGTTTFGAPSTPSTRPARPSASSGSRSRVSTFRSSTRAEARTKAPGFRRALEWPLPSNRAARRPARQTPTSSATPRASRAPCRATGGSSRA